MTTPNRFTPYTSNDETSSYVIEQSILQKVRSIIFSKKTVAITLAGILAYSGNNDMQIVKKPYEDVVEDFLDNQNNSKNTKWIQVNGIEYASGYISKENNMPYESAPLIKIQFDKDDNIKDITDMGWPDDNGDFISLKAMIQRNKALLSKDMKNNVDIEHLWYSVGTNIVNERVFASETVQLSRKLPD